MDNMKHRLSQTTFCKALALLALVAAVALPLNVQAQRDEEIAGESSTLHYTLSNGLHMWLEGPEGSEVETPVLLAGNSYGAEIHVHAESPINLHTQVGQYYLALDIQTDPANPRIVNIPQADFNRYCVWSRTGYTGYYFQEWDNFRYYLIGTRNELRVEKVEVGASTAYYAKFFNWDFGAATLDITYRNGQRHEAYYWVMYDTTGHEADPQNGVWRMSGDTYSRPEAHVRRSDDVLTYCDAVPVVVEGGDTTWRPAGAGALYLPVEVTFHEKSVDFPAGQGLTGLTLNETTLKYGDQLLATPQLSIPTGGVPVTRGYYEYIEEIDRYGMNSNYRQRSDPGYGSAGNNTTRTFYYWETNPFERKDNPPASHNETVEVASRHFSITRSALRWVDTATVGDQFQVRCTGVPNAGTGGWIYYTVTYTNGVVQKDSVHFDFSTEVAHAPFPTPTNAPVVKGFVVGGGRMANVSGNTNVTVHSADSIYALYGGNDIAGWVQGSVGATIKLGTEKTNADHPVHIGYAYGGGCGFYTYQGISPITVDGSYVDPYLYNGNATSLEYQAYFFNGKVYKWNSLPADYATYALQAISEENYAPYANAAWNDADLVADFDFRYIPDWRCSGDPYSSAVDLTEHGNGGTCMADADKQYLGTVPYIKTAHITVGVDGHAGNDYILIDSLFGGAENAFIGATSHELLPANAVTLDIHGGSIFTVFGGNNYGGSVATTSTVFVNVHNTKLTTEKAIENTYFTGYGREFGIRYLFGGGNLVDGSHANVSITGGMIDTCYLGGNMADVNRPVREVNCTGANFIFDNDSITKQWEGGVLVDKPLYDASNVGNEWANYDNLVNQSPDRYNSEIGRYNVRVLFGGNNRAPMATIATINLTAGGISSVYGGGNAGDMNFALDYHTVPIIRDSAEVGFTGWKFQRPTAISTVVHSNPNSRIIVENVYGGCRMANVKGSTILWLSGGVFGYAHGGNDISGDVGSELGEGSYAVIDRNAVVLQDVYGGSDGYYHCSKNGRYLGGDEYLLNDYNLEPYDPRDEYVGLLVPTHNNTNLYLNGGKVLYSAYGGGVKAHVGFLDGSNPKISVGGVERNLNVLGGYQKGTIHVQMSGNTVVGSETHHGVGFDHGDGNAYGGGYLSYLYGCGYAAVGGKTKILGSLYAGNDCMGSLNSFGAYSLPEVRDKEGNLVHAAISEADYKASDGTPLNYDAGDGTYNAAYSTYLLLEDSVQINCVYGSGNGDYNYDNVGSLVPGPVCHFEYTEVTPLQTSVFVDINTNNTSMIDTVFGGGNGVGVRENVHILFNSKTDQLTVGTIFGGNNRENMESCVPDIILTKGKVKSVFGGGNNGSMNGSEDFLDICDEEVNGVSTYVLVNTDQVTITDSLFGGCRKADVRGMAYIDIRKTQAEGINYVYGGNDISGNVYGNTRIDVSGGKVNNIYGGSNGRYDYDFLGLDDYAVYAFRSDHSPANLVADHCAGSPFVDSTTVNLYGGHINNNVYGGGSMGDCRATRVEVNDRVCPAKLTPDHLTISGAVYGGGEGDWEHLQQTHRGNVAKPEHSDGVEGGTYVHLHHANDLASAKAYGGGRGGDVENTYIHVYDTWTEPFDAIYGGCWGSHVFGTATLTLEGSDLGGAQNAFQVFGGNDYTGNVFRSVVNIHSGKYGSIYGAGNGDYDYSVQPFGGTPKIWIPKRNTLPNTEFVEVNFFDGHVDSNLFGGGLMGTTWRMKTNDLGEHITTPVDEGVDGVVYYRTPDTAQTVATAYDDPTKYSYIVVNVHGGTFDNNIYAGASGKTDQLVYGLKVLNMDGGDVKESVYGGSQRVNDGYPAECAEGTSADPAANTTLRPSSILNIAGGIVKASVYGAGYQGNTYGSVYVNVGSKAIENSKVWERDIAGSVDSYTNFKPGETDGVSPALTPGHVILDASVYGGANWGSNDGSFDFRVPGFYGGESRIYVDGEGYNTQGSSTSTLPTMDIANSIIGSGTSVQGGDVHNSIHVYNYGAVDFGSCHASKTLRSIQRADELYLWNTAIFYSGATDAASAYPSQQLTIMRVDTVKVRGYNVIDLNAVMTEVAQLHFYEDELDGDGNLVHTTNQDLIVNDPSQCRNDMQVCDRLHVIDPVNNKYAAMVVNNGVNVDIMTTEGEGRGYGFVEGFGYLFAETGTNAVVTARAKYGSVNATDGGFMASCADSNLVIADQSGTSIVWDSCAHAGIDCNLAEYPYNNFRTSYRVWSVGQGKRTRFAVLLAHAQPELLPQDDKKVKLYDDSTSTNYDLALAHAELVLPPTTPGHYYRLGTDGVTIEDDNAVLRFVDRTWHPVSWADVGTDPNVAQTPAQGTWEQPALADGSSRSDLRGVKLIQDNPATTFGLVMTSGKNFATTGTNTYREPKTYSGTWNQGGTAISGNNHVNIIQNFYSAQVGADVNASPVMDLYLTYSTNFSSTMLGTVYFTLDEYKAVPRRTGYNGTDITTNTGDTIPGQYIDSNLNQPINVAITIATLLEKFKDMEYDLLAMYNEGRSNTFIRKAVLPATLHSRELYLDSISWWPEDCDATDFLLTGDSATVINATDPNVFRVGVQPMDNISSTLTSTVGWHMINQDTAADVFSTAMPYTGASKTATMQFSKKSGSSATCAAYDKVGLTGQGLHIGELDGRGLAALNLSLTYDGNKVYPDGVVGHLDLHFTAYNPVDTSKFKIRVNVKCRTVGDTIFLASADHVSRCGINLTPGSLADVDPGNTQKIGKRPSKYLQNFMQAFDASIYEEGDVIAIIDTMKITDAVSIRGVDYFAVPVIRYTGHHHDLPGECGVFRGTMIDVSTDDGVLSATCVDFGGGSVGRITDVTDDDSRYPKYWNATLNTPANDPYKRLDTNQVYGPIIAVHDGGTVTLSNGTSLHSNYNAYTDTDIKRRGSAVSVTKGGNLVFVNSVDIENNFVPAQVGDHPTNGAVYVDSGNVTLNPSHKATAVNITKNFIYDNSDRYWTNYSDAASHVVRFMVDTNYTKTAEKRNVFLTRTPDASDAVMKDDQSDMIDMVSVLPDKTLIGISKWFPGEDMRDTIRFAFGHKFTDLLQATHVNNNFVSDEGYNIFYEYNVDNSRIFLHRCATFHHQVASVPLPYNNGGTLLAGDVLTYQPLVSATCPTGGDEIIYRVQGGFFPYTYTWSGSSDKTRTTAVVNNTLISQVEGGNYVNYIDAIADTLLTPHVSMTPHEFSDTLKYHVEAKDVSGFCTLKKDIKVTLKKTDVDNPDRFVVENDGSANGWTDPDTAVRALGTRNYKAIKITPKVWVNRNDATILARVPGDDNDYVYQEVINIDPLTGDETVTGHELENLLFCEGDIIRLTTTPRGESTKFIMWDFDPYYSQTASYVVPSRNSDVVAYYGPGNYWKDHVNTAAEAHAVLDGNYDYTTRAAAGDGTAGYVTTYNGDVHIYNENGLAWLVSVVNGYNGQQVRPFYFNKVFIHQKDDGSAYDMKDYLWTPVGTQQYGFRGRFIGVGKPSVVTDSSTTPLVGDQVVIRNIIVNEPSMYHVGFFGNLDTAQISGIKLEAVFARGGHYVGGLAANSTHSKIDNCSVSDEIEDASTTSILTTHYVSGGILGRSAHDEITNSTSAAKYVGDAVYSGGMVGHGTSTSVSNSGVLNISRMSGLYIGGIAGYLDGVAPHTRMIFFHSDGAPSTLANNYVQLLAENKRQQRVGGIVGYAENTVLENNYSYGVMRNSQSHGGVAGALNNNTFANHNYYAASDANQAVGVAAPSASLSDNASFRGRGNAVTISQPVYGVNNLTRVLNRWVRQQNANGGRYKTWRSDIEEVHDGYPLFGQPDLIPVSDTLLVDGCEQVEYQGIVYNEDAEFAFSIVDSVEMVDSTLVTLIRLHHATSTQLSDTALLGEDYSGYGFFVSATESLLLRRTLDSAGYASLVLSDTLQTAFGCDSVVTLTLTFHSDGSTEDIVEVSETTEVKVYPNPTVNVVNVDAEQMSHVEIYDNEGRVLQNRDTYDASHVTLDLSYYPSGIYYIRVHTPNGITIQKVIKR